MNFRNKKKKATLSDAPPLHDEQVVQEHHRLQREDGRGGGLDDPVDHTFCCSSRRTQISDNSHVIDRIVQHRRQKVSVRQLTPAVAAVWPPPRKQDSRHEELDSA